MPEFKCKKSPDGNWQVQWFESDQAQWMEILQRVKALEDRRFVPGGKNWSIPDTEKNRLDLVKIGFRLECAPSSPQKEIGPPAWINEPIPEELFPGLRPYQLDAIRFLYHRGGRGLIADEQGTGKTCMALSFLKWMSFERPVLIVVKAALKTQWVREWGKWLGDTRKVEILSGKTTYPLKNHRSYVINWDILVDWVGEINGRGRLIPNGPLSEIPFRCIIGDEIQAIGNMKSKRTKAFRFLGQKVPAVIGLSGTPIRTRPAQFFPLLNLLDPDVFPDHWQFLKRYCAPKHTGFGWEFKGATNIEELHEKLSPVMIRRKKSDVMKDLPQKIYSVVPFSKALQGDRKAYDEAWEIFRESLGDMRGVKAESALDSLSNTAFALKRDIVCRWVKDFLESGEKLVLFVYHRAVVDFLAKEFSGHSVVVNGSVTGEKKDAAIQKFIEDAGTNLFIGNILAAGVGVDGLQKVCQNVAFAEFAGATDLYQAEDRLHRFGQRGSVNVYYLIAEDTVDEDRMEYVDAQREVVDKLVDGEAPPEEELLTHLYAKYKK